MVHIQPPGEGERLGKAILRVAFPELTVTEYAIEAGSEPGEPHYHANHADSFLVLDGELEFRVDGKVLRAPAGSLVVAPPHAVHAFPIATSSRARFLNFHTPGGFERYLRELTALRAKGEAPTPEFLAGHDMFMV